MPGEERGGPAKELEEVVVREENPPKTVKIGSTLAPKQRLCYKKCSGTTMMLFSLRKVFGSIQEENSISVSSLKDRGLGKVDKPQQIPKVSSLKDRGPGKETNRGTNCSEF
ncbi:hypothetical protein LWI29_023256 [Acer saccharum]|uniref:Uncharacterized protein n=1 Tax=Acer saccharum TaxID=4024 RepID=A0AA39RN33_ACESA|nr:hypothetical protein LWI29_023256 [Acer saccharum]